MRLGGPLGWVLIRFLTVGIAIIGAAGGNVPRQESTSTTSSSSTTPTSSSMPSFSFADDFLQPFTCQAIIVFWSYTGPKGSTNLYATNVDVSQAIPTPSSTISYSNAVVDATITVMLATNIDPSVSFFKWSSVNVPQGWYIFTASIPSQSYSAKSDPFYVHRGNDTSCISTVLTSTTTSSRPNSISSSALASSSPVAVAAVSQHNAVSIGAIIGGTIGLVIVIAAIAMGYLWCRRGRRKSNRRTSKGEYPDRWKELHLADSRGALRGSQLRPYHQSPNVSFGTVVQSDEGAGAEKCSIHSKLESSALSCEQDDVALSTLPVLQHQSSRSRAFAIERPYSSSSTTTLGLSSHGHSNIPESRPSTRDAMSKRRSLDSVAYPPTRPTLSPTTNLSRDQRASVQIPTPRRQDSRLSLQPGSPTAVDAAKQANRQSFGRKRKPVPAYDGEKPGTPSSPPPLPTSPVSPSSSPLDSLLSTSPTSGSLGHYVTRNHSTQGSGHPDQTRKGDFGPGAKPLHYLIPDMPMSQQ